MAAVDRALAILDAFTEGDQKLSLADVSRRTGLYKSTVIRLAKSLERFSYLVRSEDGTYRLGSKVLSLGSLYQKHFRTSELVPPILAQIAGELHEGASFYVRDESQRLCLHRVDAARAVRDSVHEGDRLPLTVGAAGHVLLAFSGLSGERYDQIRKELYSASYGERDPETAAVACPVFGAGQKFIGALSVSGPRYRIEALGVKRILPVLFKHARNLTRTLGGDPDAPALAAWSRTPKAARPPAARPAAVRSAAR
ncbi:MAG TPA: IclR family transcriptional regulator [Burkholderiales bacterium]|nr:IclR family transcriptional regulator [Burkholderiales bacterium]